MPCERSPPVRCVENALTAVVLPLLTTAITLIRTPFNPCWTSSAILPARRHIAVLGEMLELGRWAEPLHRDVGVTPRCGINVLVGIRGVARLLVKAATELVWRRDAAYFFEDPAEAGDWSALVRATRGCHTVQRLARHTRREGFGEAPRVA